MSAKSLCFTLNNYTKEEEENLISKLKYEYLIFGKEIGENGTPHLQGYVEFRGSKRFDTLKKFNSRIHWEARKGKQFQAIEYCKKDGDFREFGTLTVQLPGKRNDLQVVRQRLEEGRGIRGVISEHVNLQAIRYAEKLLTYNEPQRNWKPSVTWIWGKTGAGKSRLGHELCGTDYYSKDGEKWWDGYDAHENIILDDFRAGNMKLNYLLKVLDRYPMRVEVKGGYRQLLAKKIIITSIHSPDSCYNTEIDKLKEPIQQLIRRLDKIILITDDVGNDYAVWSKHFKDKSDDSSVEEVLVEEVGGNTIAPTSSTEQEEDFCML